MHVTVFFKLPNITIQLFKFMYVHIPRLDHTFFLSEVLHNIVYVILCLQIFTSSQYTAET